MTQPEPKQPTPIRDWHVVECPVCGKVREEAKPGSEIKWRCPRCKNEVTAKIAA